MTGPFYPPIPGYKTPAIGQLRIEITPLSDPKPMSMWRVIVSQYANSPIIDDLILSFQDAIDMTENWSLLCDNVLNIQTASGWGLDLIGRILKCPRRLQLSNLVKWFGWGDQSTAEFSFLPLYSGQASGTVAYDMTDTVYRRVLIARTMLLNSPGTVPAINAIMRYLWAGRGNAYLQDGVASHYLGFAHTGAETFGFGILYAGEALPANMSMTYIFNFVASPVDLAIAEQSGVLPRPPGVAANYVYQSS